VDVLYLLRMQHERMIDARVPSLREYTTGYGLTPRRAERLQAHALVMHPGPMNRGVEMAVDPAELPGSVVLHQVTNGVAVRMAVLFELLGSGADLAQGG
jgi:aspartate carbamoyltransferase catalytic subunit